jgi:hypothetical protein
LLGASTEQILRTNTTKVKQKKVLEFEGMEERGGVYDPMGDKKRQDDTALILRNVILKHTIADSRQSH